MKKLLLVLLAVLFVSPASADRFLNAGESYVLEGDFPAGTEVKLRIDPFIGIDARDAVECKADGKRILPISRIILHNGSYAGFDGVSMLFEARSIDDYMLDFTVPEACGTITVTSPKDGIGIMLKDISLLIPFSEDVNLSVCEQVLIDFLEYWKIGSIPDMVKLSAESWRAKASFLANGAQQQLYAQFIGKKLYESRLEGKPTGADHDTSRTIDVLLDIIMKEEHRLYRYNVLMLYENGRWLVDPSSLVSGTRLYK